MHGSELAPAYGSGCLGIDGKIDCKLQSITKCANL